MIFGIYMLDSVYFRLCILPGVCLRANLYPFLCNWRYICNLRIYLFFILFQETMNLPVYITKDEDEDTQYQVVVDAIPIASADTFLLAFAHYLASFYCLNLAYPACLRKTLHFFQRVILNIQDTLPIDKSIVKILDKINRALSTKWMKCSLKSDIIPITSYKKIARKSLVTSNDLWPPWKTIGIIYSPKFKHLLLFEISCLQAKASQAYMHTRHHHRIDSFSLRLSLRKIWRFFTWCFGSVHYWEFCQISFFFTTKQHNFILLKL